MAKIPKPHKAVGEDYLAATKPSKIVRHVFPFPARTVWAALLDAKAWTQWLPITKMEWTSPTPFGIGATRIAEIGEEVVWETFFAWEEGRRMAFWFDASTMPITAAVEDYRINDHALGCELVWLGRASGPPIIGQMVSTQLSKAVGDGLPQLEALIRDDPKRFR